MNAQTDERFYDRADAHIELANAQCAEAGQGQVGASLSYGAARFNAFAAALQAGSREAMQARRQELLDRYVGEYRKMLEEHFDDYIARYDAYMR